jgi:hypothetical protein
MKTQVLETREAPVKWWAAQDARMRSLVNSSLYTQKQKTQVERMKLALEMVYAAKGVHIAYGKTGISVKVDGALIADRANLKLLEAEWAAQGVTKKVTAQGITYRVSA